MIISALAALLANPPGSLSYHFLLSAILGLLYVVSHAQHRGAGRARAARWMLASGWLVSLQLMLLAGTTANWLLLVQDAAVLPALVHFVDFAGILTFAWVIFFPRSHQLGDRSLLFAIVIDALFLAVTVIGVRMAFVGLAIEPAYLIWRSVGFVTAGAVIVTLLLRRPQQWLLAAAGFLALWIGYGLQIGLSGGADPLSGIIRLLNLLGYPLLASAGLRTLTLEAGEEQRRAEHDMSRLQYTQSAEADVAQALASLASAQTDSELADRAARAVAETMRSEYCLLLSPPDPKGNFSVASGYDLIREQKIEGAPLDDSRTPVLASALEQGKVLSIPSRSKSPDIYTLRSLLGVDSTGPALLIPISEANQVHGGLLLLSPYARRSWSEEQQDTLQNIAGHLAQAFERLKSKPPGSTEAYDALLEAQERLRQLERDNMRLFEALHAEGEIDVSELEVLDLDTLRASEAEETIAILEAEIERLKTAQPATPDLPTSEEMEQLKDELQSTLEDLVSARAEIERLRSELKTDGRGKTDRADLEAIASIAQELRQPMSSVMGYTDLLLGESVGLLGAMQRKFLERVHSAVERMGALLNDLVQLTRLESGELELQPTRVDLLGCVEEAVENTGSALRDKRQALRMDFPDEVPAVHGDPDAITQILNHLLRNAIAASSEGSEILLSAKVEASHQDGFLMLSVRDSGEGIPPEELGRVFHRLHPSSQGMIQGLGDGGSGLSVVKGLSEALGGRVWVESEVGVGSTFTVLLPLEQAQPTPRPHAEADEAEPSQTEA
ncbi:MAG: ATP-binding protein [Anaerolineales bacterium]|nr:ATP-binding protein [Anaerolineales bacterium]